MSNISHIKGAGGAMRKVPREFTDAELLRDVRRQAMPQTEQVIDTDNTAPAQALRFFARLAGWMRGKP